MVVLERITDFFLGLNAGQWLKIRVAQISDGALTWVKSQHSCAQSSECTAVYGAMTANDVLKGTGLWPIPGVADDPPADARHLHHFWGNFGARGDDWVHHGTRDGGTQQSPRRRHTPRSKTDAERMSEALALVRARRTGCEESHV